MAILRPFRGILYDPRRVDLSRVVAPPYDVISAKDQARFYAQDPHNVVRLIAGEVRPTDSTEDNKYVRAAGFFNGWLREGILGREPEPSLYVYRHEFVDPTSGERKVRHGILGVVELEPFGTTILPHERTHPRAKADRLSLTRAVQANLSPIFCMYEDSGRAVRPVLEVVLGRQPRLSFETGEGERHTVWSVSDPAAIESLEEALRPSRLYVADGHHRYETALNFRNKMRADHPEAPPDAAFNFVLMLLVDVKDPGLAILPTHRLLQDLEGFDPEALVRRLSTRHRVVEHANPKALLAALQQPTPGHRIAMAVSRSHSGGASRHEVPPPLAGEGQGGGLYTVDIEPSIPADPVSSLDVSVLHREILQRELGLQDALLEQEHFVSYSRDPEASLERVREGAAQAAFLLRPPAVSDVVAVANAGLVMPQKSTYFYPKPASGIVFNPLSADIRI
jgi:uncharacterized protein (DUF1015 family)